MKELLTPPERLRARAAAWYEQLKARPEVDPQSVAAIGFCFGGQCVLELARSDADVKAVISYHGLLSTSMPAATGAGGEQLIHVLVVHRAAEVELPGAGLGGDEIGVVLARRVEAR